MKLIYIHQYFVTNEGTTGTRSYDVSRYLVEMGWQVTVITGLHDQSSFARMPWWRLIRKLSRWVMPSTVRPGSSGMVPPVHSVVPPPYTMEDHEPRWPHVRSASPEPGSWKKRLA